MSGIKDIFGKGIRHLAVVLLFALLCHGCGTLDKDLPADEDMINTFHAKEATFNEMVELLQEFPSWEGFDSMNKKYYSSQYHGYWPDVAECRSYFGEERASKIDSLLREIECQQIHFGYFYTGAGKTVSPPIEFTFDCYNDGLSIGPSISKSFIYCSDPIDSLALKSEIYYLEDRPSTIFMADGDLDSLYYDIRKKANELEEGISFINLRRRIADNWLIELKYFN